MTKRTLRCAYFASLSLVLAAATSLQAASTIEFTQETLPNGLKVIYAPLHQAPVVHVRLFYHVGSRNERPDRQGFAHMFEHMMFRGSEHVAPEEHMRLIRIVGGTCNAFTTFDQTVYLNTVPANQLELPLYLEADRMASFKVSDNIYQIERKVVGEEARLRENKPYGTVYEEFLKNAFTTHSYQWTAIGKMDHLAVAQSSELQEFFNHYYVPNNAILVIAGDFDPAATKDLVHKYFSWIPRGADVDTSVPQEPEQKEARRAEIVKSVPLSVLLKGWHVPGYAAADRPALSLLSTILAAGSSSRLDRQLVNNADPLCSDVDANVGQMEDPSLFSINATALAGKPMDTIESTILAAISDVQANGVTEEELAKAKTLHRVGTIRSRDTAEALATQLGTQALMAGDPNRVNTLEDRYQAVTVADIRAVAQKYLRPENSTTLLVKPGSHANAINYGEAAAAPVKPAEPKPVSPKPVTFPSDWQPKAPINQKQLAAHYDKGTEMTVAGVKVIVMKDSRLPIVNWDLTIRGGSDGEPEGKDGLGSLTAALMRRGAGDMNYKQLSQELESRGIAISVSDGGDHTKIAGMSTTDQVDYMMDIATKIFREPTFPADEFAKLKAQTLSGLRVSKDTPNNVASEELMAALYPDSPQGRTATVASVSSVTLDDVKNYYKTTFRPEGAFLLISGDVTEASAKALAEKLLANWPAGAPPVAEYKPAKAPPHRRIILVDRPNSKQATIRIGIPAYDLRSPEKFAGSVGSQILSAGIDSRLGRYVRAQKGLAYGVTGNFSATRHGGTFTAGTDTAIRSTGAAIEAILKVLNDVCTDTVTDEELSQTKSRVAGSMVLATQTVGQLAGLRSQIILNDYPLDYYDVYPSRIAAVNAEQIRDVMKKYVLPDHLVIVVVAPADAVKAQLEPLGEVEVLPMPNARTTDSAKK